MKSMTDQPKIMICMGSQSDWPTMSAAKDILEQLDVACDERIISAHRTPDRLTSFAKSAADDGLQVIIAGAGGAAHLPGMIASHTHLPVLGVPVESKALKGMDSLLSIVQMPKGVPVATVIGGGYDDDPIALARRHALVVRAAALVCRRRGMGMLTSDRGHVL